MGPSRTPCPAGTLAASYVCYREFAGRDAPILVNGNQRADFGDVRITGQLAGRDPVVIFEIPDRRDKRCSAPTAVVCPVKDVATNLRHLFHPISPFRTDVGRIVVRR